MNDKSPRQQLSQKSKSLKEKRAAKNAKKGDAVVIAVPPPSKKRPGH